MKLRTVNKKLRIDNTGKLGRKYQHFLELLKELQKRELSEEVAQSINEEIDKVNALSRSEKELEKQIDLSQHAILKLIEKELQLVPKNHYKRTWLALGIAAFGIPLGVAFGSSLGNMAYIGIGLAMGLAIGLGIGSAKDKKAEEEGLQLDWDINF